MSGCASILQEAVFNASFYSKGHSASTYLAFESRLCTGLSTDANFEFYLPLTGTALDAFTHAAAVLVARWDPAMEAAVRADPSFTSNSLKTSRDVVLQYYLAVCEVRMGQY